MATQQKVIVIGAGPVGTLAALYAAQRGDDVEVYELRGDPRDASTVPLNWTRSINLALSERGITAMRQASQPLIEQVLKDAVPMGGRMIHGRNPTGALYEAAQAYDVHGRNIHAIDRRHLNNTLLDHLESYPNVKLIFKHKLTGADYATRRAWLEDHTGEVKVDGTKTRYPEIEVTFDFLVGTDGAHSAARFHLMKFARLSYEQTYIDTLWCEFQIAPRTSTDGTSSFALSPHHLHIWPGSIHMFIAIPSADQTFTCTLFAPESEFKELRNTCDLSVAVPAYFRKHFPGVTPELIAETELVRQFRANPALPLISIKCAPYHFRDSGVILGDAAHAMVPFYGQGMNAGLEDVRVLFECLDAAGVHAASDAATHDNDEVIRKARALALERYTELRAPDAAAINDLALGNYYEMRAGVVSPVYKLRKTVEETISKWLPSSGWATQYARVSFTNQRYSQVEEDVGRQKRIELVGGIGLLAVASVTALGVYLRRSA